MGKSEDAPPRGWKWVLNGEDEEPVLSPWELGLGPL